MTEPVLVASPTHLKRGCASNLKSQNMLPTGSPSLQFVPSQPEDDASGNESEEIRWNEEVDRAEVESYTSEPEFQPESESEAEDTSADVLTLHRLRTLKNKRLPSAAGLQMYRSIHENHHQQILAPDETDVATDNNLPVMVLRFKLLSPVKFDSMCERVPDSRCFSGQSLSGFEPYRRLHGQIAKLGCEFWQEKPTLW